LISSTPNADFIAAKKVRVKLTRVKLTGDGTKFGKRLNVTCFGFAILDEGELAYSATGNHCIAIWRESESYESLKMAVQDIVVKLVVLSKSQCLELHLILNTIWEEIESF